MMDDTMTNELGSGKEVVVAESRHHPGIFLGGLTTTTKNLSG
jgi:hypothetical protein